MIFRECEEGTYTGTLVAESTASCGKYVQFSSGGDNCATPAIDMPGGLYTALFSLAVASNASSSNLAVLKVKCRDKNGTLVTVKHRELKPSDLPASNKWYQIVIPDICINESDYDIQVVIENYATGITNLYADWMALIPMAAGGSWRMDYIGSLYSNFGQNIAANGYFNVDIDLPNDCVTNLRVQISKGNGGNDERLYARFSLVDSNGYTIWGDHAEMYHAWMYGDYKKTVMGYTGKPDGIGTPRLNIYLRNLEAHAITYDINVLWARSPLAFL